MQNAIEGGRKTGRPKTRWLDNITRWRGESAEAIYRASYDRTRWREITIEGSFSGDALTFDSDKGSVIGNNNDKILKIVQVV